MHCAKVAFSSEPASHRLTRFGSSQMGPWRASWKSHGVCWSPRSAGFSMMMSVPQRIAADRRAAVRLAGDLVCPVELAFVPCRDVVDAEYVLAVSHDGWPVLIRVEEAGDGVG